MMENPQAFPCLDGSHGALSMRDPGMTLRDWFAGRALSGYLAGVIIDTTDGGVPVLEEPEVIARRCYRWSDAMLAERMKRGGQ